MPLGFPSLYCYLTTILLPDCRLLSNRYQNSIRPLPYFYQISTRILSDRYHISTRILSDRYYVSTRFLLDLHHISTRFLSYFYQISTRFLSYFQIYRQFSVSMISPILSNFVFYLFYDFYLSNRLYILFCISNKYSFEYCHLVF